VRRSWPVFSRKFATAGFLGLLLFFSHVDLMFCRCVLLGEGDDFLEEFLLWFFVL
jgi:hypothetical protein